MVAPTHPAISTFLYPCTPTGRSSRNKNREDKQGAIPASIPLMLERLNINPEQWLCTCTRIEKGYHLAIGPIERLEEFAERLQQHWLKGVKPAGNFILLPHPLKYKQYIQTCFSTAVSEN